MEARFTVLLWEVGLAVAVQIGVLLAILATVRKSSARMESLADEVHKRAIPTLDAAQTFLTKTSPRVETILDNVAASSTLLREQLEHMDKTVTDIVDRARLQVIRTDQLVTRTLDRVEETTDIVHHSVISPVRQVAALIDGISAGLNALLGRKSRSNGERVGVPQDEMFI